MNSNLKLIIDENESYNNCPSVLVTESTEDGIPMLRLKGPFIQADKINKNGRKYLFEELKPEVDRFIMECVETHHAVGNIEHPASAEIDPKEAAFTIDSLELDEANKVWNGVATILADDQKNGIYGTPNGNILASLVQHGQRVGFSTRGVGKIVGDTVRDFHICTIDCVWKPSIDQFCEGVLESRSFKHEGDRIVECVEGCEQVVSESDTLQRLRRELGEARFWNEFNRRFHGLHV